MPEGRTSRAGGEPGHTGDNAGMIAFAAFTEREPGGLNPAHLALEIAPSLPLAVG